MMESQVKNTPSAPMRALVRAGKLAGLGFALIGAAMATFLIGTWGANRPHEVSGEALFFTLLAVIAALCPVVLFLMASGWRNRGANPLQAVHYWSIAVALLYSGVVLTFFGRLGWAWIR